MKLKQCCIYSVHMRTEPKDPYRKFWYEYLYHYTPILYIESIINNCTFNSCFFKYICQKIVKNCN